MPLSGGTFTDGRYTKPFAGAYVNTISINGLVDQYGERGYTAIPIELSWCPDGEVFTISADTIRENALYVLGYNYEDEKLKYIRETLRGASVIHLRKLNSNGAKASCTISEANYNGGRGNNISHTVQYSARTTGEDIYYDVTTYVETKKVETQTVKTAAELKKNNFVTFKTGAVLAITAGISLTGGSDGIVTVADHQAALGQLSNYYFNTLICGSSDRAVKDMYIEYTKDKADNKGKKFQVIVHNIDDANHERVIATPNNTIPDLVYWIGGKRAGIDINKSLVDTVYDGELEVDVKNYVDIDYENFIKKGQFVFYSDGGTIKVLADINTLITTTETKGEWFKDNQAICIADQSAMDKAKEFNNNFLAKIPNDEQGRLSFWNFITTYNKDFLQDKKRVITNYDPSKTEVFKIDKKKIGCKEFLEGVNAFEQLYLTTVFV